MFELISSDVHVNVVYGKKYQPTAGFRFRLIFSKQFHSIEESHDMSWMFEDFFPVQSYVELAPLLSVRSHSFIGIRTKKFWSQRNTVHRHKFKIMHDLEINLSKAKYAICLKKICLKNENKNLRVFNA